MDKDIGHAPVLSSAADAAGAVGGGTGVYVEEVPNVPDTEARKQVMSPIVDHIVELKADFQKQLAALRQLTDNWRHEKDPTSELGNNKSDNLINDRSDDGSTVLIDANLVPRAVQQAPDVADAGDLVTRQATVDSREESSLNAARPLQDQVDAASPVETVPATVASENAMDPITIASDSSKSDDIGNHSVKDEAITESDPPKLLDDAQITPIAESREEENTDALLINAAARGVADAALPEEQERLASNSAAGEASSSPGASALDATSTEPGQSSSGARQETLSTPELSNTANRSAATKNDETPLVEVGKSAEFGGALGISFADSSAPQQQQQQADISQTSSRNESSIANTAGANAPKEEVQSSTSELSRHVSAEERIPRQDDEPQVVAVEALLSAVKSLPEQFLTPFIAAMQMLSPKKPGAGDAGVTSDVQLMNRLNTLRSATAEDLNGTPRAEVIDKTADINKEELIPATAPEEKTEAPRKNDKLERSRSGKAVDGEIIKSKVPQSRMAKSRSSVPDIKQQHWDVRSVRTDADGEPNISQTNIATDLTSNSIDLKLADRNEEAPTANEAVAPIVEVATAETSRAGVVSGIRSRKNSLEIAGTPAENDIEARSAEGESASTEGSVGEAPAGESSSSHARSLTASSTHNQSVIRESLGHAIASDDAPTVASSSSPSSSPSKEAENSSVASNERLFADNALIVPSRCKIPSASANDSNAATSRTPTSNIAPIDPIVHDHSHAGHSPVSRETIRDATDAQSAMSNINERDEGQLDDSPHVAPLPLTFLPVTSSSVLEVLDNLETTSRHDQNDTKPIVPKNAVHVSEKVEQTISVTYRTPAHDGKNETTLKENVPVEQNATDDLSITQLQADGSISPLIEPIAANLNNPHDRKVASAAVKSDSSTREQTSDDQSVKNTEVDFNRDTLPSAMNNQGIIVPLNDHFAQEEATRPFTSSDIGVESRSESASHEISIASSDPESSRDIEFLDNNKSESVAIPETSKSILDVESVANAKVASDENTRNQLCELTNNNNNVLNDALPQLSAEDSLVANSNGNVSYSVGLDEEFCLEDETARSRAERDQDAARASNSATGSILRALRNFNIFFTSQTEKKNIAPTVNEDPITTNVGDVTPGMPDTFEIKISESPVITVNDCAPINETANIIERESGQIVDADTISMDEAKHVGPENEVSVVARNEPPVEPPLKLSNNESMREDAKQANQFGRSVIAKPVVKHRSKSPLKKVVRRKSPVKIIRKSTGVPWKNVAQKSPNSTTVIKAKATANEITKNSNRATQSSESRTKESPKSARIASCKTDDRSKSAAKTPDKSVRPLSNIYAQKTAENIKISDHKGVSASDKENVPIINNVANSGPQTKSENSGSTQLTHSKNKKIEDVRKEQSKISKNTKANENETEVKQTANRESRISKDDRMLVKTLWTEKKKDNSKPKSFLPSKIPVLVHRRIAQSTDTVSSNSSKLSDTSSLKSISTKLPIASQGVSKLALKIPGNASNLPTVRKINSKENLKANQIKSSSARAIEITENAKDKQLLLSERESHAEEGTVEGGETEELPKVKSTESESTLNENSQAPSPTHNDPLANLSEQLEVENAIEESSDAFSSDSEYSGEGEDTETAKYVSDHNSEYNSVEEFTDAELLLEKTLNEIRSEISDSEEEQTSESEESEDVTYSYETESHDRGSISFEDSEGAVREDEREIKSSEPEDSEVEGMYEELPSDKEEVSEQERQFETIDKEVDNATRNEVNDTEINISNRTESMSPEVTQEDERDKLEPLKAAAVVAMTESSQAEITAEINEDPLGVSRDLETSDPNIIITDPAIASTAEVEESAEFKEGIQSKARDSEENEASLENTNRIQEKDDPSTMRNDAITKVASAKRARIGRRASTGSKEVKLERDETLKGVDRARAPRKRFSLVASCIRRFEGQDYEERAHVDSITRKGKPQSPKAEREVSRRELPSGMIPRRRVSCQKKVPASERVVKNRLFRPLTGQCLQTARKNGMGGGGRVVPRFL